MQNKPLSVVLLVWAVRPLPAELTHAGAVSAAAVGWPWLNEEGLIYKSGGLRAVGCGGGAARLSSPSRLVRGVFPGGSHRAPSASTFRGSAGIVLIIVPLANASHTGEP